jgi:hypothetical protein
LAHIQQVTYLTSALTAVTLLIGFYVYSRGAAVKSKWSHASGPPYVFLVRRLIKHMDNYFIAHTEKKTIIASNWYSSPDIVKTLALRLKGVGKNLSND